MAWSWKILKAAVEQVILFPSKQCFDDYVAKLREKGEPCEVISYTFNNDGTFSAVMRKRYNQNAFLKSDDSALREC